MDGWLVLHRAEAAGLVSFVTAISCAVSLFSCARRRRCVWLSAGLCMLCVLCAHNGQFFTGV